MEQKIKKPCTLKQYQKETNSSLSPSEKKSDLNSFDTLINDTDVGLNSTSNLIQSIDNFSKQFIRKISSKSSEMNKY